MRWLTDGARSQRPADRSQGFRIDMLWTDSRYRSLFFQVIGSDGAHAAGRLVGVEQRFRTSPRWARNSASGFMTDPSSYDINQRLIDYTSRSSHWRRQRLSASSTRFWWR